MPEAAGSSRSRRCRGTGLNQCRVLYLIPSLRSGGAEIQLLSLVKGLDKSRFNPTVAVFYRGEALDGQFSAVPGLRLVFLGRKSALDFRFLPSLVGLIRRGRFGLLQPFNLSARFFALLAAAISGGVPTVVTERTARPLLTTAGSRIYWLLEKYAMRRATVVVSNSEAGRDYLRSIGIPGRITRVIYNGIDLDRVRPQRAPDRVRTSIGLGENQTVVGMVARLAPEKDPWTFLEAAERVHRVDPRVRFLLIGDGPLAGTLRARGGTGLHFVGYSDSVADWLQIMDIMVLTSSRVEGCSNAILEAMALGRPVIATRVGGNRELIRHGETGLLIEPRDPAALAEAIQRLLGDRTLRLELAARARAQLSERFSQQEMVEQYQILYSQLI